jgi:hypothetical protein
MSNDIIVISPVDNVVVVQPETTEVSVSLTNNTTVISAVENVVIVELEEQIVSVASQGLQGPAGANAVYDTDQAVISMQVFG